MVAALQQRKLNPVVARDVIYTSHAYATMSVSACDCLSVTEVHWRIIANSRLISIKHCMHKYGGILNQKLECWHQTNM